MMPAADRDLIIAMVDRQLDAHGIVDEEQRRAARAVAINAACGAYALAADSRDAREYGDALLMSRAAR
jgi:hypothetical protein